MRIPATALPASRRPVASILLLAWIALTGLPGPARGQAPEPPGSDYTVGPTDVLTIEVYDEADLSGEYRVSQSGAIVFPLVGQVPVAGRTAPEIAEHLKVLLEKDYLYEATINVTVTSYRSRTVKILGNVLRPGVYYLEGPTRLLDVLSQAGGVASSGGEVNRGQAARVVRLEEAPDPEGDGTKMVTRNLSIDLYELLVEGREEANLLLESGDTVYVPETRFVHVVGEVKQPGSFPFEEGMTVLKAITLAGGATLKGAPRNAVIKRIREGKEQEIEVSLEDLLQPDDIVDVPRSFW